MRTKLGVWAGLCRLTHGCEIWPRSRVRSSHESARRGANWRAAGVLGVSGYRRRFEVRAQPQVQPEVRARNFLPDIRGFFAKNDRIVSLAILTLGIYAEEGPENGRF